MLNTIVLPTALALLLMVPRESLALASLNTAAAALTSLEPTLTEFNTRVVEGEIGHAEIRVWMHNGDRQLHGCGFNFLVTDHTNSTSSALFPAKTVHQCRGREWKLRFTAQGGVYGTYVQHGPLPLSSIEVHADGWHDTFVNRMCIGWPMVIEPRFFCLNNDFLKACKLLTFKWQTINLEWNDMKFTRTIRASHKIIFRDVENLINAFKKLRARGVDRDRLQAVCDRIDLVKGDAYPDQWTCPAEKAVNQVAWGGMHVGWMGQYEKHDVNPYACSAGSLSL